MEEKIRNLFSKSVEESEVFISTLNDIKSWSTDRLLSVVETIMEQLIPFLLSSQYLPDSPPSLPYNQLTNWMNE